MKEADPIQSRIDGRESAYEDADEASHPAWLSRKVTRMKETSPATRAMILPSRVRNHIWAT